MGVDDSGEIVLADEILTPDSSRFWSAATYMPGQAQKSLDKQFFRDWLLSISFDKTTPLVVPENIQRKTMEKYIEVFRILTEQEPEL